MLWLARCGVSSAVDTLCPTPHWHQHARYRSSSDLKERVNSKRMQVSKLRTVRYLICWSSRCFVHGVHKTYNSHVCTPFSIKRSKRQRYLLLKTRSFILLCLLGYTRWPSMTLRRKCWPDVVHNHATFSNLHQMRRAIVRWKALCILDNIVNDCGG